MPENQEMLRQALLTDLAALRENLDKTRTTVLTLPIGKARTNLELIQKEQFAIGSQHEEYFDGNGLTALRSVRPQRYCLGNGESPS